MNVTNNRRRQDSRRRIEEAFETLLAEHSLSDIRVTEICKLAAVNRTTFYANYEDVYALSTAYQETLLQRMLALYQREMRAGEHSFDFEKLFTHIRDNQVAYKTYFKLNSEKEFRWMMYDQRLAESLFAPEHVKYHIAFFGSGLNAIIRLWLEGGCEESPEVMAEIIRSEYRKPKTPWG